MLIGHGGVPIRGQARQARRMGGQILQGDFPPVFLGRDHALGQIKADGIREFYHAVAGQPGQGNAGENLGDGTQLKQRLAIRWVGRPGVGLAKPANIGPARLVNANHQSGVRVPVDII